MGNLSQKWICRQWPRYQLYWWGPLHWLIVNLISGVDTCASAKSFGKELMISDDFWCLANAEFSTGVPCTSQVDRDFDVWCCYIRIGIVMNFWALPVTNALAEWCVIRLGSRYISVSIVIRFKKTRWIPNEVFALAELGETSTLGDQWVYWPSW